MRKIAAAGRHKDRGKGFVPVPVTVRARRDQARLSAGSRPTMDVRFSTSSAPVVDAANDETDGIACSVDEAGRRLGCKRTMVFKLLKEGRLVAAPKLGRKRMVLVASVVALLEAGGVEAPAPARQTARPRRTGRVDGKTLAAEIAKLPVG
jgi:hypothetical protein